MCRGIRILKRVNSMLVNAARRHRHKAINIHQEGVKVWPVPYTQTVSHFPIPSPFRSKPNSTREVVFAFPFECGYGYTKLFIETSDEAFCV